MDKLNIILYLLLLIVVMLSYCVYKEQSKERFITCPDPASLVGELKLSKDEMKMLLNKCSKNLPTFSSGMNAQQIDDQIGKCLVSCYPDLEIIRDNKQLKLCRIPCQNRQSPECLECVKRKYCEISEGGMAVVPCDFSATGERGEAIVDADVEAEKRMIEIQQKRAAEQVQASKNSK